MPRIATLLLLTLGLVACGPEPVDNIPPLELGEPPALRHVMFEVDELNRAIEPILRAPGQTPVVASAASSMLRWAQDEAWTVYLSEPDFIGNEALFNAYLGWLRAGAQQLATAAEAADVDGMRAGFVRAQQSCVACHKRFQPNI